MKLTNSHFLYIIVMIIKKYKKFLESKKVDMWESIPNSIKELVKIFSNKGKKLYLVGGAVRDFLKGDDPKDFDLCTDANPNEIIDIIGPSYKTNLQGSAFGVVVVYTNDQPDGIEIATFRSDEYDGKSRNPKVQYTTIDKDVQRRDLTINSLFYDLDKREVVDLVGGISDLDDKMIRMVGDPSQRILEDPLRILRVCRFAYRYGYTIHKDTKDAIISEKKSLSRITRERIWEEIKKSFGYKKNFKDYLTIIKDLELLEEIFPGLKLNKDLVESDSIEVHIANLLKDNDPTKLEKNLILALKIESSVSSKVCFLIKMMSLSPDNAFLLYKERNKNHVDSDLIIDWGRIIQMDSSLLKAFVDYKPTVSAEELMERGFKGPDLGREIMRLETDKFKNMI